MQSSMTRAAAVAVAASALLAASSSAQRTGVGPRWQAWLGCWTAVQPGGEYGSPQFAGPTVCITPTSDADVVEVSTIGDGKLLSRDRIDASGRERAIDVKGCTGAQKAEWSADERRVYLKAATSCEGMKGATTALLAMTANGDWIDVRDVMAGGGSTVRVARYHDTGIPSSVPADIAAALTGRSMSSQSARIAAGAPIGTNAVIESLRMTDSSVVSAWLLERGQRFSLGAQELLALADAGVPGAVTDAMVAVSYPGAFQMARADDRRANLDEDVYAGRRTHVYMDPFYDPYGYGYSRYGYNSYGYGYGYPGYGGYGGYYGGPPIVIVTGNQAANGNASGQMVKGRGYTQNQPSPTTDRWGSERPSSSSSGSSSAGSTSSGSSAPAPAAQPATRTAHPKP